MIVNGKDKFNLFSGVGAQHHVYGTDFHGSCLTPLDRLWIRSSFSLVLCSEAFGMVLQLCSKCRVRTYSFGMISKERSDYRDILRCHVQGCTVYALKAKLQNDQLLPKWNRRALLGQFVGFLDDHLSMVAYVCHLTTGYISPLFHVIFDNLFETVN